MNDSEQPGPSQSSTGSGNAQASHGSDASIVTNIGTYNENVTYNMHGDNSSETNNIVNDAREESANKLLNDMPTTAIPNHGSLPRGSNTDSLPAVNRIFVGRRAIFLEVAAVLKGAQPQTVIRAAATTGQGGFGKTQFASEFVHRYGRYFAGGIFWLDFSSKEDIPSQIASCAPAGYGSREPVDSATASAAKIDYVNAIWCDVIPKLLVFDNCDDEDLFAKWRPNTGASRILITTRRPEWRPHLGVDAIAIGELEREESVALLCSQRTDITSDNPAVNAIAEKLGDLPLALHVAGRYLNKYRFGNQGVLEHYLEQISDNSALSHPSLGANDRTPNGHEANLTKTFQISYQAIQQDDPASVVARYIAVTVSTLAPGVRVPIDVVKEAIEPLLSQSGHAEETVSEALRLLIDDLGLVDVDSYSSVRIHRLVSLFVIAEEKGLVSQARNSMLSTLRRITNPLISSASSVHLLTWGAHLRHITSPDMARASEDVGVLLHTLGCFAYDAAEYGSAKDSFERARKVFIKSVGPQAPMIADIESMLGAVLLDLGDFGDACDRFKRSLAMMEKNAQSYSVERIALANNRLGVALLELGDGGNAYYHFNKALVLCSSRTNRTSAAITAAVFGGLGTLLKRLKNYPRALDYYERSLAEKRKLFAEPDSQIATALSNRGGALHSLNKLNLAISDFEQALEMDAEIFGDSSPAAARDKHDLASAISEMGNSESSFDLLDRAKMLFEDALSTFRTYYKPEHLTIKNAEHNLAETVLRLARLSYPSE